MRTTLSWWTDDLAAASRMDAMPKHFSAILGHELAIRCDINALQQEQSQSPDEIGL